MAHYHVINVQTGGVINKVTSANNEKPSDDINACNKKRKKQADRMRDAWLETHFKNADLIVKEIKTWEDK